MGTADSGFTVQMDASPSVGGNDSGIRPMELLLIGLGGCTAIDVLSILRKKRQDITGMKVNLDSRQTSEHPRVFTHILVKYIVRGKNVNPRAVGRAVELSVTKYCPVQAMLGSVVEIDHSYEIIEEA